VPSGSRDPIYGYYFSIWEHAKSRRRGIIKTCASDKRNVLLSANPARGSEDNDRLFIYLDLLLCISSSVGYILLNVLEVYVLQWLENGL
jgi:hypothetical protein